jgi:phenylacetate-coenzyme A ligase PaaK-like adenylate-forming protein
MRSWGRVDDLRKIRGVFFTPAIVEEVIRSQFPEVMEFETLLTREGAMPVLTLRVEFAPSVAENQFKELRGRIREKLTIRSNLTSRLIVKPEFAVTSKIESI